MFSRQRVGYFRGDHNLEFILPVPVALRDVAEVRVEGLGALDRVGPELLGLRV